MTVGPDYTRMERSIRDYRGPVQLHRIFQVHLNRRDSGYGPTVGVFTTGWENEARENAQARADKYDLPIYELPPFVNAARVLPDLCDGVFIAHLVHVQFGERVYSGFGRMYDTRRMEKIRRRCPPEFPWPDEY